MKAIKSISILILSGFIAMMSFTACTSENDMVQLAPNAADNSEYPISDVKVMASGYVGAEVTPELLTRAANGQLDPKDVKVKNLTEEEAKAYDENKAGKGGTSYFYMYKWCTLNYRGKSADGSQKDLSELVVWPYRLRNVSPSQLVIGCHSTITSDAQRPTNFSEQSSASEMNMLALFANGLSQSALVIVPDYEGYGSTVSSPHPYCSREITAEQVVTGVRAGLSWFEKNVKKMDSNWSGVAIGYSQGGAVAASVLRYCQKNNVNSLRLKGAVCGDGPYDPTATLKRYIEMNKLYMPVASALLLKGMVDTDKDLKAMGCTYQDFVTEKFYNTGIFDMIQAKNQTTDDIQAALLKYSYDNGDNGGFTMICKSNDGFVPYTRNNAKNRKFYLDNGKGYNYCTVDQCLKPGVIAYFRDGTITGDVPEVLLKGLKNALAKNALTADNFMPSSGFTFFHSDGDEVVPYCNFESVRNTWGAQASQFLTYQSNTTLHVATGKVFFVSYCGKMVSEILNNQWQPREETIGGGWW